MGFASRGGHVPLRAEAGAVAGQRPCSARAAAAPAPLPQPWHQPALNFPKALQDRGEAIIITAIVLRDCFLVPYLPRDISSRDLITL